MKIVTWNINGIRATKKPLKEILDSLQADIICLQETKVTRDQLESDIALIDGYNSYFSFSQTRAGYSGVATYCKNEFAPVKAQAGLTDAYELDAGHGRIGCYGNQSEMFTPERLIEIDKEGRALLTQHRVRAAEDDGEQLVTIINLYCPRADPDKPERQTFKLDFYKALEERTRSLTEHNNFVVALGDFNTSHRQIDHCDPNDPIMFYDNPARLWMDGFLVNRGDYSLLGKEASEEGAVSQGRFVDMFRYFYPKKQDMFTCWCTSSRARQTNYGTRIDYIFADKKFVKHVTECEQMTDFQGSDHCPVNGTIKCEFIPAKECPPLCTQHVTDFGGKQRNLLSYFSNAATADSNNIQPMDNNVLKRSLESNGFGPAKKRKGPKTASQTTLTSFVTKPSKRDEPKQKVLQTKQSDTVLSFKAKTQPGKKPSEASAFWKNVLKGPEPAPLCSGHKEPCVLRTVKKAGPNLGKQFYCCSKPDGLRSNPNANCQHFEWKKKKT